MILAGAQPTPKQQSFSQKIHAPNHYSYKWMSRVYVDALHNDQIIIWPMYILPDAFSFLFVWFIHFLSRRLGPARRVAIVAFRGNESVINTSEIVEQSKVTERGGTAHRSGDLCVFYYLAWITTRYIVDWPSPLAALHRTIATVLSFERRSINKSTCVHFQPKSRKRKKKYE